MISGDADDVDLYAHKTQAGRYVSVELYRLVHAVNAMELLATGVNCKCMCARRFPTKVFFVVGASLQRKRES